MTDPNPQPPPPVLHVVQQAQTTSYRGVDVALRFADDPADEGAHVSVGASRVNDGEWGKPSASLSPHYLHITPKRWPLIRAAFDLAFDEYAQRFEAARSLHCDGERE